MLSWLSRILLLIQAAIGLLLALSLPVEAQLKFSAERLQDGTKYILVSGRFDSNDDLLTFANLVNNHKPEFVSFDSPGGNIVKALTLGRLIRLLGVTTFQTRPYQCDSACTFAFVGGQNRFATAGSLGVHRSSLRKYGDRNPELEGEALQHLTGDILTYLREMGVSSELLELALKTEATDMRHLTLGEMRKLKVVTINPDSKPQSPELAPQNPIMPQEPKRVPTARPDDLNDCDRLAANQYDQQKHKAAPGVDYNTLLAQRKQATAQCELAVEQFPNELRFQYQLARAIELDDSTRAAKAYMRLINVKYLAAYDNLGWMYQTGRYGGKINKAAATKLFREGATLGDLDSMHSLGVALWDENPQQALDWLKRAANFGHLEAKKNVQKLSDQLQQRQTNETPSLFQLFRQN